uniref:Uncharacterized protein n=1 Tax=Lepeophtheirus salmonis TaxID=72036 RepID=A0A0K2U6E8_LEPSM
MFLGRHLPHRFHQEALPQFCDVGQEQPTSYEFLVQLNCCLTFSLILSRTSQ